MPPLESRYFLRFLPDGDGAGGTPSTIPVTPPPATTPGQGTTPPPAATPPADSGSGGDPAWLPDRLRRAGDSAIKALLDDVGLDKLDDLKALITDAKKRADGEKTAAQLAEEGKTKAEKKLAEMEAEVKRLQAQQTADKVTAGIVKLVSEGPLKAQYPEDIASQIQKDSPDAFTQLWKDNTFDEKTAKTLIEAIKKARPAWFSSGGPGSPSNARGLTPEPGEQAKKDLANRKLFRL